MLARQTEKYEITAIRHVTASAFAIAGAHLNEMLQPAIQVLLIQRRVRYELAPETGNNRGFIATAHLANSSLTSICSSHSALADFRGKVTANDLPLWNYGGFLAVSWIG
jgi:hypothetical protein